MRILSLSPVAALSVLAGVVSATRPCPDPLAPFTWTMSEWTYDAPDPTGRGRAAIDSTVGLYLVVGGVDFSCIGSWPETWEGRADDGRSLIWFSCVVNRGRQVDTTVSFAMDWRAEKLYTAHTYVCTDGARQGSPIIATGSANLDLECERSTPGGRPTRCITRSRQLTITTQPKLAAINTCVAESTGSASWEVSGYISALGPGSRAPPGSTFHVLNLADGTKFDCAASEAIQEDGTMQGHCTPVGGAAGNSTTLTFSFDREVRLITLSQAQACPGSGSPITTRGAGYVPAFPCLSNFSPTCEEEAVFWVGGQAEQA
ncbi:hypothetical protein B0T14DRAFT_606942 [Immersiella caudata]|uniref:Uncharacterized protein n=1 Tax=Immersiella caudata TaxID=314043 RepID=A0AA40BV59_9PEZI|nr:hypothetical protein B0T14DRAFT_606942 [Immersiella caudata]